MSKTIVVIQTIMLLVVYALARSQMENMYLDKEHNFIVDTWQNRVEYYSLFFCALSTLLTGFGYSLDRLFKYFFKNE